MDQRNPELPLVPVSEVGRIVQAMRGRFAPKYGPRRVLRVPIVPRVMDFRNMEPRPRDALMTLQPETVVVNGERRRAFRVEMIVLDDEIRHGDWDT